MLDSTTHPGMTRNSSHLASIYGNDFLELVWENGPVVVRSGSSNRTQKTPSSCIKYSISSSPKETNRDEDGGITKRTRLSTLYSLLDHFPSQRNSDMSSLHQSNVHDSSQSSQTKNSCKLNEEFANLLRPEKDSNKMVTVTTGNNNSHNLCTYSSQHCLPSSPLKKQTTDSNVPTTSQATNSQNLKCDQRARKVNFSNFSIPAIFLKSTSYQGNIATGATRNARVEEIEASNKVEKAEEVETAKGSDGLKGLKKQTPFAERSEAEAPQDEHSEAVAHNSAALGIHTSHAQLCDQNSSSEALRAKGKANNPNLCNEPFLASSSVCSLGASNDPNFCTRKLEDTDDSTYFSDNDVETEDAVKQTPDREGSRVKRGRNAEVHNLSEKKRREKINKKMRTLKELVPNCNKVDKASMLDDAIDYLKTLKLQLQMMSMSSGLWPLMNMMLPGAAHHMNGPHLPQLMGGGMGFRPPQFPIPPLSAITDNRLQMFGFNNQMPHMPMPHAPFFPIIANSNSIQPHLATRTGTTNLGEHLPNFSNLHASLPNNSDFHAKPENAAKLAPNQVSLHHHNTSPLAVPFIFPQR